MEAKRAELRFSCQSPAGTRLDLSRIRHTWWMDISCHKEVMSEKTPRAEVTPAGAFICLMDQL